MVWPPRVAFPRVLVAATASLCVSPSWFLPIAASKVSFPFTSFINLPLINRLVSALFPIYSDLRDACDASHVKGSVDPAAAVLGDLNQSLANTKVELSEALVESRAHSSDFEEPHTVNADDAGAITVTDAARVLGHKQDSHQSLQDMKLIVRVTMVGQSLAVPSNGASCNVMLMSLQVVTSLSYILCAALGYMSFPTTAAGNILKTYPASPANDILVLSMAASIILSYPGDPTPFRPSLFYFYSFGSPLPQ